MGDPVRSLPKEFRGELPSGITQAEAFCPGCLVVSGPGYSEDKDLPKRLAKAFPEWPATPETPLPISWADPYLLSSPVQIRQDNLDKTPLLA